jgi:hypothetical protein
MIKGRIYFNDVTDLITQISGIFGLARDRGYVWSYRYVTPHCFWFQIEFASGDTVRSTGYSQPPECRVRAVSAGM